MHKRREGFIGVAGGKAWYEIVGDAKEIPLIAVHGGPGYPHDSLESLEDLATERKVIFYDQLGCGNSQKTTDKSLWTAEYFVKELQDVVNHLKLEEYHLLGHSWGSALAASFALIQPHGLKSLILADPYLSTPVWEKDAKKLLSQMPEALQKALRGGDIKSQEYKKANDEFYYRYVWRIHDRPVACIRATNKENAEIYNYMWGSEEFNATGTLKDFDLSKNLHKIKIPTLFLCGRFDEATPESTEYFRKLVPNSQIKIFEKSAHMPHWTEREKFMTIIKNFLRNAELTG